VFFFYACFLWQPSAYLHALLPNARRSRDQPKFQKLTGTIDARPTNIIPQR
jgi:hypothetical protein